MTLFKACQRCGGDLRTSSDLYGDYMQCVQCGHLIDLPLEEAPVDAEVSAAA